MNNQNEKTRKRAERIYFIADDIERKMFQTRLFKKYGLAQDAKSAAERKAAREIIRTADIELAKQIVEIDKLYLNILRLNALDGRKNVKYYQKLNIYRHRSNLEDAMKVLEKGLDVPEFDEKLRDYNQYIEQHIVREKHGKTFRTLSKTDLKNPPKDEAGKPQALETMITNTKEKYENAGRYFYQLNCLEKQRERGL